MAFGPTGNGPRGEINITPLVDIVLVLLIIFMVATPILQMGLDVDVPPKVTAVASPEQPQPDQILVTVRTDGAYLDGSKMASLEALQAAVRERLASKPESERVVFINAEDAVSYEMAVAAMDAARGGGAVQVGFLTDPP